MSKGWKYNPFLKGLDYYEAGAGGVTTFLGLIDTPSSYVGNAGKCLVVNSLENALEFVVLDAANRTLSNLENVAVNTDILPDTDSLRNLGSSILFWANLYLNNLTTAAALNVQNLAEDSLLYVRNDGNIGIGTINPDFKLDVNGAVRAINYNAGINIETLTDNKTLNPAVDKMYQYLDPGIANRTITLATTTAYAGDRFVIRHNGNYSNPYYLQINQGAVVLDYIYAGTIKEFIFNGINWVSAGTGTGENDNKKGNIVIGYNAKGYTNSVAVGAYAKGYTNGVAVGVYTQGYSNGVAVGAYAQGYSYGVAVGNATYGYSNGAAVGNAAYGRNYGVGVGYYAQGYNYGVAVGAYAQGQMKGVAIGYYAGYGLDTYEDRYNIFIGYQAGMGIITGSNNIIIGRQDITTGRITTGSNNILIGYEVGVGIDANDSNQLNIGNLIFGTGLETGAILSTGKVGIGIANPIISGNGRLHMAGDTMRLDTARTITASTDPGNVGEICWDADFLYICVDTNTWKRVALSAW